MQPHKTLPPMGVAALELAQEVGFRVFPVHEPHPQGGCSCSLRGECQSAAKHPRIDSGFKSATTHPEQIAEWWDRWPTANIGLYPGASQLLVVDVDGEVGEATARAAGAYDVQTLEAVTSRGVHRYFRLEEGVTIGNIKLPELDVRAHAGYVLAPPSAHATGFVYRWRGELGAIAPVPERLLDGILNAGKKGAAAELQRQRNLRAFLPPSGQVDQRTERRVLNYAKAIGYGIGEGGRNNSAYSFARFLSHDVSLSDHEAWCFLDTWNRYNSPPLSEPELTAVHRSARRPGGRSTAA